MGLCDVAKGSIRIVSRVYIPGKALNLAVSGNCMWLKQNGFEMYFKIDYIGLLTIKPRGFIVDRYHILK